MIWVVLSCVIMIMGGIVMCDNCHDHGWMFDMGWIVM